MKCFASPATCNGSCPGRPFDEQLKKSLYQYNCGPERSSSKVKEVFSSMTPAQRKELRQAFKKNGYDINIMRC